MKRKILFFVFVSVSLLGKSQIPVTDAAANTNLITTVMTLGQQLTTLIEQKNKLDESLDFMRKVNSKITTAKSISYILERQKNLSERCTEIIRQPNLSQSTLLTLTATVENISSNNRRLLQLTQTLLTSSVKMNDAERLSALRDIEKSIEQDEKRLYKCSSVLREYGTLKRLLK